MIIASILFLAQAFYIEKMDGYPETYYVRPQPNFMPVNTPVVPPAARILDNVTIGSPSLGRAEYEFPNEDNGFPIRRVIPREERVQIPIQERLQMEQIATQQATDQARLAAIQSDLTIRKNNAEYDANINQQATQGMRALRNLNPQSEDFPSQVAELQEMYPLAFQNPGFTNSVNRLDQIYKNRIASQEILNRQQENDQRDDARYRERMGLELRQTAATLGPDYLKDYEDSLRQDIEAGRSPDPTRAYSVIAQRAARDRMAYEAEQKRQERENAPMSNSDYLATIKARATLLGRKDDATSGWDESTEAPQLEALNNQIRTYEEQRGIRREPSQPQSTPVPQYREGQTATNRQTGQKMVYRNGNWVNQ